MCSTPHEERFAAYCAQCIAEWTCLASDPDMFENVSKALGSPATHRWHEVFSLDPDLLSFVPQPVAAVVLLWPSQSQSILDHKAHQRAASAQPPPSEAKAPCYMRQRVRNACGTVAIAHAVANSGDSFALPAESVLGMFVEQCQGLESATDRGKLFAQSEGIEAAHRACVEDERWRDRGNGDQPQGDVKEHFCAFVRVGAHLWELDGSLEQEAIYHGETSAATFLNDTADKVRSEFMAREPESNMWSILALAPSGE